MKTLFALLCVAMLAACSNSPTFDKAAMQRVCDARRAALQHCTKVQGPILGLGKPVPILDKVAFAAEVDKIKAVGCPQVFVADWSFYRAACRDAASNHPEAIGAALAGRMPVDYDARLQRAAEDMAQTCGRYGVNW